MEHDGEFSAYAAARWSALVRSGVVLGYSAEEAQDLAQTTLLRCYKAWHKVERADDRDAYVYQILLNCHRDSRRRRWWGEQPAATLPDQTVPDATNQVVIADSVERALADLSVAHREAVVLRYYANLTEAQIAHVLNVAPGTVKSRLSRAVAQLATSTHLIEGPKT